MLTNWVTVTPYTESTNSYGSVSATAGTTASFYMSIQPQTASRNTQNDRLNGERRATGYAMYDNRTNLVNGSVVTFNGQNWRIDGNWRNVAGKSIMVEVDLVEFGE